MLCRQNTEEILLGKWGWVERSSTMYDFCTDIPGYCSAFLCEKN